MAKFTLSAHADDVIAKLNESGVFQTNRDTFLRELAPKTKTRLVRILKDKSTAKNTAMVSNVLRAFSETPERMLYDFIVAFFAIIPPKEEVEPIVEGVLPKDVLKEDIFKTLRDEVTEFEVDLSTPMEKFIRKTGAVNDTLIRVLREFLKITESGVCTQLSGYRKSTLDVFLKHLIHMYDWAETDEDKMNFILGFAPDVKKDIRPAIINLIQEEMDDGSSSPPVINKNTLMTDFIRSTGVVDSALLSGISEYLNVNPSSICLELQKYTTKKLGTFLTHMTTKYPLKDNAPETEDSTDFVLEDYCVDQLFHQTDYDMGALIEETGLSYNLLMDIQQGKHIPSLTELHILAKAFGYDLQMLIKEALQAEEENKEPSFLENFNRHAASNFTGTENFTKVLSMHHLVLAAMDTWGCTAEAAEEAITDSLEPQTIDDFFLQIKTNLD